MKSLFLIGGVWIVLALSAGSSATVPSCDVSDYTHEGNGQGLLDREVVLIGEVHGTAETPSIVSEIVCNAASAGRRVVLALEAPENVSVDVFSEQKRARIPPSLLANSRQYWLTPAAQADGRTSQGQKKLVRFLQELNGLTDMFIDIVTVDIPYGNFDQSHMRDLVMAEKIKELQESGFYDQVFFFGGHYHTRLVNGEAETSSSQSVAQYLETGHFSSVLIYPLGGATWACMGPRGNIICSTHSLPARDSLTGGRQNSLVRLEKKGWIDYDGVIELPVVTASFPINTF